MRRTNRRRKTTNINISGINNIQYTKSDIQGIHKYPYTTDVKEDIKIDGLTKKYSKKEIIDEIYEFGIESEIKNILEHFNIKHPESRKLEDYSHRALTAASFVNNRNKELKGDTK